MAKQQKEPGWYVRSEIAVIFGVSVSYLDREIRPKLPPDAQRKSGRRLLWHAASVFELLSARPQSSGKQASGHELAVREAEAKVAKLESQARLLELEIERRKGEWVRRDEYEGRIAWLVDRLRTIADMLRRRAGAKVTKAYNDLLERLAQEMETD